VPPEGIVDDAQVGDIEHRYIKMRQAVSAARQQPTQAFAEQRRLARPVSGSKYDRKWTASCLVKVLQGEGQVGGDLLEQQQFILTNNGAGPGAAEEGSDRVLSTRSGRHANDRTPAALSSFRPSMT